MSVYVRNNAGRWIDVTEVIGRKLVERLRREEDMYLYVDRDHFRFTFDMPMISVADDIADAR